MAARDLYQSDWFKKARGYVEAVGADWRILSAGHGLVHPGQLLAPYDTTLLNMTARQHWDWASMVANDLFALDLSAGVTMLAGRLYRQPLMHWLDKRGVAVAVPMAGLGIGHQKAWLKSNTPRAAQ